jgi:hypothetical protein
MVEHTRAKLINDINRCCLNQTIACLVACHLSFWPCALGLQDSRKVFLVIVSSQLQVNTTSVCVIRFVSELREARVLCQPKNGWQSFAKALSRRATYR